MSLLIACFTFIIALTVFTTLLTLESFNRIVNDIHHNLLLQDLLIPVMFIIIYILWGAWFKMLQGLQVWG